MHTELERLYGLDEAMLVLGRISRSTLYRRHKQGDLHFVKLGARTFIRASELERFLDSLSPVAGRAPASRKDR